MYQLSRRPQMATSAEQQPPPGRVAIAEDRGDGRDGDEAQTPGHVDDVVAADAAADQRM